MPEEGINPYDPPGVLYELWEWFLRLSRTRGRDATGQPQPLAEDQIGWFFHNRRLRVQEWELDVLRILDSLALESMST